MTIAATYPRKSSWHRIMAGRGYLAVLATSVLSSWAVLNSNIPSAFGVAGVVLGIACLIWALERWFPHRRDWQPTPRLFALDFFHTLVSSHGVAPLVRAGFVALAVALSGASGGLGLGLWPSHWPVLAQLLLAIPVADFGVYWAHRLMHRTDWGWRIHAVHHSPTKLYFMASARSHPLNAIVSVSSQFGTLVLLGVEPHVLSLWAVFMATNGLLQHANVDFRPGLLNRLLATCDVHRAHHSRHDDSRNFGNNTMIWDQLFGTWSKPPDRADDVGARGYEIPEDYLTHLKLPLALQNYEERG